MKLGDSHQFEYTITEADTAAKVAFDPSDVYPEVLATARMVALMEIAASRLIAPLVGEGQLSVGVDVNVRHLAANGVGKTISAKATYTSFDGKLHAFEVEIFDPSGTCGRGTHTRAIIDNDRLIQGALRRESSPR
ncbi:MAG: thioesterase [Gammaproteobacteria bacterium]|nr:thioesterase [Gammaproteobacteria bacterium]